MTLSRGALRGEKVQYENGVGCSIWYPDSDDDEAGFVFDFPVEDIDDMIALLRDIKVAQPDIYVPEEQSDQAQDVIDH